MEKRVNDLFPFKSLEICMAAETAHEIICHCKHCFSVIYHPSNTMPNSLESLTSSLAFPPSHEATDIGANKFCFKLIYISAS